MALKTVIKEGEEKIIYIKCYSASFTQYNKKQIL